MQTVCCVAVATGFVLISSASLFAQTSFEKILIPVYAPSGATGAGGSSWRTELTLVNTSDNGVIIRGFEYGCPFACFDPPTPPDRTYTPPPSPIFTSDVHAVFFHVEEGRVDDVQIELRVRETSKNTQPLGIEIPVVRESDASTRKLNLLNIPLGPGLRHTLRIYDFHPQEADPAQVMVRLFATNPQQGLIIYSAPRDRLLLSGVMQFDVPNETTSVNYRPGYIEMNNFTDRVALSAEERIRVEIEPVTPGIRFWAFVTITSETHLVTTVTP